MWPVVFLGLEMIDPSTSGIFACIFAAEGFFGGSLFVA